MTTTIRVPAPPNVVLKAICDICNVNFKVVKADTNFMDFDLLAASINLKISYGTAAFLFVLNPVNNTLTEINIVADYILDLALATYNEGNVIMTVSQIIRYLSDSLKRQGYIK